MRSDKQRIQEILTQTIVSLCNSGLSFETELSVEGLLGITLDKADVFLVNIKEVVSLAQSAQETSITSSVSGSSPTGQQQTQPRSPRHGIKRRRTQDDEVNPQALSPSLRSQQHAFIPQAFKQDPSFRTPTVFSQPGLAGSSQAMSVSSLHRRSLSLETAPLASPPPHSHTLSCSYSQSSSDSHSLPPDNAPQPLSVESDVIVKEEPQDSPSGPAGPSDVVDLAVGGSQQLPRTAGHELDPTGSGTLSQSLVLGIPTSSAVDRGRLSAPPGLATPRLFADPQQQQGPTPVSIHTVRAYIRDVKRIKMWLREERGELREMEAIPLATLDAYFADMWTSIRKKDGNDYELSSLQQMKSSLDRHLRERTNGRISLATPGFDLCHESLLRKRSALRKQREALGTAASSTTMTKDSVDPAGDGDGLSPSPGPTTQSCPGLSPVSVSHAGPSPGSPRAPSLTSTPTHSASAAPPLSPLHMQVRPGDDNKDKAPDTSLPGPAFFLKQFPPK